MNSKLFFDALRKIIREEVRHAIRQELNESKTTKKPYKDVIEHGVKLQSQVAKPTKKRYVSDPMLNSLLAETSTYTDDNWSTIDFRSELARAYSPGMQSSNVIQDITGGEHNVQELQQTEAGAAVVKALTRDYSSLMKAIDKKKS
jgi:hypothetical protein